jgi:hypothetical protein
VTPETEHVRLLQRLTISVIQLGAGIAVTLLSDQQMLNPRINIENASRLSIHIGPAKISAVGGGCLADTEPAGSPHLPPLDSALQPVLRSALKGV